MPDIKTVRQHIAWSYANLACAHHIIEEGSHKYSRTSYMIRAKLNKGLVTGTMSMRTLFDDEKIKYRHPDSCCYCGSKENLHMDHLIPKIKGGADSSDNIVWSCQSCNSSKRDRDVLVWLKKKERKPSIFLLRRYIKLVAQYCEREGIMDLEVEDIHGLELPFNLMALPYKLEPITEFFLWPDSMTANG